MDSVNSKLQPHERRAALNAAGFNIRKDSGQINNIKNIGYEDDNPDLCINLDTGLCRDFGEPDYNGDIVHLIGKITGKDFKGTMKFIEDSIGRTLSSSRDGISKARDLYGEPAQKNPEPKKKGAPKKPPFWNKETWKRMQKCIDVFDKKGVPEAMNYIHTYDGISVQDMKKTRCGIYGYGDYEFGLSGKNYNRKAYFIFPYETGAMLYRRDKDGKDVKHIKGSSPGDSFYGTDKEDEKHSCIFLMKSPRECMSAMHYMSQFKILGLVTGEEIGKISDNQRKQIGRILPDEKAAIYCIFDCDNPDAYDKSLKSCNVLNDAFGDKALIHLVNIHRNFDGKRKDFTDLVQHSMKKKAWDHTAEDFTKLAEDTHSPFIKSLMEAQIIK